jgi:phage repressor protein C with HTH and peptisase S24 domain
MLALLHKQSSTLTAHFGKLTYMPTLQDRIAEIMESSQLSVGKLAEIAEVTSSAATQWKDGPTKSLKTGPASKLAAKTGFSAMWIATGEGPKYLAPSAPTPSNVAEAPALMPSRRVPVVGHVKGGMDGFLEEMQYAVGHGEGFVEYWTKDPEAYALRVKGDSMHPRYRHGEFIVVTPSIEAQPGSDVMVKLKDGRKLLKELNWIRDEEIQLVSLNDNYAPMTISREDVESIQRVGGGVPADAFQENRHH